MAAGSSDRSSADHWGDAVPPKQHRELPLERSDRAGNDGNDSSGDARDIQHGREHVPAPVLRDLQSLVTANEEQSASDHERDAERAAHLYRRLRVARRRRQWHDQQRDEGVAKPELGDLAQTEESMGIHSAPRLNAATSPAKPASVTESAATEKRYGVSGITRQPSRSSVSASGGREDDTATIERGARGALSRSRADRAPV